MSKIICISNHKGGVGKTTSTLNIGATLAKLKFKILLVDLDPQANLSASLGIRNSETSTVYEALTGKQKLSPINILENLDLIPSTNDLSGAELELSAEAGREFILKELLEPIVHRYDYLMLDCPPSLGLLTLNCLVAADYVIIPVEAEYLALEGLATLSEVIKKVQKRLNKNLKLNSVFVTKYDSRKILCREVFKKTKQYFADKVLNTPIRSNVALAEAPSKGVDIFRYAPKSNGAKDYLALAKELHDNICLQSNIDNLGNTKNEGNKII